jgi:membrane associated rhomboid family serine protease
MNPTLLIIAITAIATYRGFQDPVFFAKYAGSPYQIKHNKEYYRLVSHMLLHADFMHVALNMFILYSFGEGLHYFFQVSFGSLSPLIFSLFYIIGGICGMVPLIKKYSHSAHYSCVGASGAVSAVIVAYMIAYPQSEVLFFLIPMPAYIAVILFFITERLMQQYNRARVAHEAHIGGAVFGLLFVLLIKLLSP